MESESGCPDTAGQHSPRKPCSGSQPIVLSHQFTLPSFCLPSACPQDPTCPSQNIQPVKTREQGKPGTTASSQGLPWWRPGRPQVPTRRGGQGRGPCFFWKTMGRPSPFKMPLHPQPLPFKCFPHPPLSRGEAIPVPWGDEGTAGRMGLLGRPRSVRLGDPID